MQSEISSKWLLFVFGVVGVICSAVAIFFLVLALSGVDFYSELISFVKNRDSHDSIGSASVEPVYGAPLLSERETHRGLPISLTIPKIGVTTTLEYVGVTSQGEVGVPRGPVDAAWFAFGPRPGEKGSAIITGHFGWKDDIPAVFDNLHQLRKGDRVYVEDENGAILTFVVRKIGLYGWDENAREVFASGDGGAHLNLITCEGSWDKTEKRYSNRLVVFTDRE